MPTWGEKVMTEYLQHHTPPPAHSFFNTSGRAYPDIVSLSEDFEFVWQQGWNFVGGTSCAAPVATALISLVNDAILHAHNTTLGFLNPLIYSLGQDSNSGAFFDITTGPRNTQGSCVGFAPAQGWDAISGWGGINFAKFRDGALAAVKAARTAALSP
jgi:tripeptidyl-peptidase I